MPTVDNFQGVITLVSYSHVYDHAVCMNFTLKLGVHVAIPDAQFFGSISQSGGNSNSYS